MRPEHGVDAVFVSDLHLGAVEGPRHRTFSRYVEELASRQSRPALYILGDLFHYWAGRSSESMAGHRSALETIARASRAGLAVVVVPGNRDFLLDGRMAMRYGFDLERDRLTIELGGRRVLLCHGDDLLFRDRGHLRFRSVMRSFWIRGLADFLPVPLVERIAARLRRETVTATERKRASAFEIPTEAAAQLFRGGPDTVICGHVHVQSARRLHVGETERTFYSLGAWEEEASALEFDGETFRFVTFPIE